MFGDRKVLPNMKALNKKNQIKKKKKKKKKLKNLIPSLEPPTKPKNPSHPNSFPFFLSTINNPRQTNILKSTKDLIHQFLM